MPTWSYLVRSITLDNYDNPAASLQEALTDGDLIDMELISCFPQPEHRSGELHQVPITSEGNKPYDDVWHTPTGPTFIAIFKGPAPGDE